MSDTVIKASYEVAKSVFEGKIKPRDGAKLLASESGVNINSARDLIMVFRHLMEGNSFQRGLSAPDMDYFLSRIESDFGPVVLRTAVQGLWLHLRYYEGIRKCTMHKLRAVAASHQARAALPETLTAHELSFREALHHSLQDTSERRRSRLKTALKAPARIPVVLFAYVRNPDVVAEVLYRANGYCEQCKSAAPFLRGKDGSPYLEVHHIVKLADGGEDTVENAIATCPNCHRKLHYGITDVT